MPEKSRIGRQQRIGLYQGVGADQEVRRDAFARTLVAGVAAHDACGLQRAFHRQRIMVDLARGLKGGLRGRGARCAFDNVDQQA